MVWAVLAMKCKCVKSDTLTLHCKYSIIQYNHTKSGPIHVFSSSKRALQGGLELSKVHITQCHNTSKHVLLALLIKSRNMNWNTWKIETRTLGKSTLFRDVKTQGKHVSKWQTYQICQNEWERFLGGRSNFIHTYTLQVRTSDHSHTNTNNHTLVWLWSSQELHNSHCVCVVMIVWLLTSRYFL